MSEPEIKEKVFQVLFSIAPELKDEKISSEEEFREQFDFDSLDFLNFVIGLTKEFSLDIPVKDYPQLTSINNCATYLGKNRDK